MRLPKGSPDTFYCHGPDSVRVDESQLSAIRGQWHDRLDVQYAAVPHAAVVGSLLVLPAVWATRAWRRRARRVRGRCASCGYDLRASGDRCPECGEPARRSPPPAARAA